jgi:membrane protease YdiL (CAAX protease family)
LSQIKVSLLNLGEASGGQSHFFQHIPWKATLKIALLVGALAALVNELAETNIQTSFFFSPVELLKDYGLYAPCCFLALIFAQKMSFQGFLWVRSGTRAHKGISLLVYGVLPGMLIGLVYTRQFIPFRYSPRVPIWIRLIQSPYDTLIYSLRAAITEELVFRFLLLTGFLYVLTRLFQPLANQGFRVARWIPPVFSILLSSLLFGVAHGLFGFTNAFLASLALSVCFLRGGFESVTICHFVADFVFYNLVYLNFEWLRSVQRFLLCW